MPGKRINSTDDFMAAVRERREALELTHGDVDHIVGWQDAYCSKVEGGDRSWGKRPFLMTHNAADLLQALGLAMVIVPADQAEEIADGSMKREIEQKPRANKTARKSTRTTCTIRRRG